MKTETTVSNGPEAAADARRFVRSLENRVARPVLDDAVLVVSELVTNSYKHAGNPAGFPIEVTLDLNDDRLRLEVVDHSIFDPTPESTGELQDVRWGLALVEQLSSRWGRISKGGVWAEFAT